MVQHVERVDPKLKRLRLADPKRLAQVGIEAPRAQSHDAVVPQVTLLSGLWMLQHDLGGAVGVVVKDEGTGRSRRNDHRQSIECTAVVAVEVLQRGDNRALRVGNLHKQIVIVEIATLQFSPLRNTPPDSGELVEIHRHDDIGQSVRVKHAGSGDTGRCSGAEVVDQAQLPALERPCQDARAVGKQQLVGSERQLKRAVGSQLLSAVVAHIGVVHGPVDGVGE